MRGYGLTTIGTAIKRVRLPRNLHPTKRLRPDYSTPNPQRGAGCW